MLELKVTTPAAALPVAEADDRPWVEKTHRMSKNHGAGRDARRVFAAHRVGSWPLGPPTSPVFGFTFTAGAQRVSTALLVQRRTGQEFAPGGPPPRLWLLCPPAELLPCATTAPAAPPPSGVGRPPQTEAAAAPAEAAAAPRVRPAAPKLPGHCQCPPCLRVSRRLATVLA